MDEMNIIKNIGILYRTFVSAVSKDLIETGLSFSESVFLINIGQAQGICQETLSTQLAIDKAAVARGVKDLAEKNYLEIKKSATDKRNKHLFLTAQGQKLCRQVSDLHLDWTSDVLSVLTKKQIGDFAQIIELTGDQAKVSLADRKLHSDQGQAGKPHSNRF